MADEKKLTPIKAIRKKCLSCKERSYKAVEDCKDTECTLNPYRLGKNPYSNRKPMTEEQKKAARERLAKARAGK